MIYDSRDQILSNIADDATIESRVDKSWMGTRMGIELPFSEDIGLKKNIIPEIINQKFMWVDDYFHYDDWAQ